MLRNLRKEKRRTLQDVADKIGISKMYLSEIERGNKVPSGEIIKKLAEFYVIDERTLLESFGKITLDVYIDMKKTIEMQKREIEQLKELIECQGKEMDKLYDELVESLSK